MTGKHKVSAQEILEVVFELSSSQQTVKEERDLNTDVGSEGDSEMGASCLENIQDDGNCLTWTLYEFQHKMMRIIYFKTNCNV